MPAQIKKLLKELKEGLVRIYGEQLKAVYLYGSYARGDYVQGSDVDVMIVLNKYASYWDELEKTSFLLQEVSLKYEISVSRIFMTERQWTESETPLLRNIRQDGMLA